MNVLKRDIGPIIPNQIQQFYTDYRSQSYLNSYIILDEEGGSYSQFLLWTNPYEALITHDPARQMYKGGLLIWSTHYNLSWDKLNY